jgi:hypothetical protein
MNKLTLGVLLTFFAMNSFAGKCLKTTNESQYKNLKTADKLQASMLINDVESCSSRTLTEIKNTLKVMNIAQTNKVAAELYLLKSETEPYLESQIKEDLNVAQTKLAVIQSSLALVKSELNSRK